MEYIGKIAKSLDCDPAIVYAVVKVETNGKFTLKNRTKIPILYERHYAYRLIATQNGRKYAQKLYRRYPTIVNPKSGGWGLIREQYGKLAKSIKICGKKIAHESTSFGAFQIMGANYRDCGYNSADEMARLYHQNPQEEQVKGFTNFCIRYRNGKLLKAMRSKNFKSIAKIYNGKNYWKNKYDVKMKRKYNYYKSLKEVKSLMVYRA